MAEKKIFTQEQIEELNANPYTHKAKANVVVFTLAFKEFFYSKIKEGKLSNPKIFKAAGYDPDMLGISRMDAFRRNVLKEAGSSEGFKAPRGLSHREELERAREEAEKARSTDAKVQYLESRVAHLEAQVEFLKKTAAIRKQYRSRPKK